MVYVVRCDKCDYKEEVEFACPKCGLPLNSGSHEHGTNALIVGVVTTDMKITALTEKVAKIEYHSELIDINGIGEKWTRTIMEAYPTREQLVQACKDGTLTFHKDINKLLEAQFK